MANVDLSFVRVRIPTPGNVTFVHPGVATGTGVANQSSVTALAHSGVATGTGVANQPTVIGNAGANVELSFARLSIPSSSGAAHPGYAFVSGKANAVTAKVSVNAGVATGTGVANQPSTGAGRSVNAGVATGTGVANQPTVIASTGSSSVHPGVATATGTAYNPTIAITVKVITRALADPPWTDPAVLEAVTGPSTRVTARIEIYESNGTIRWTGDTENRLIDGTISIDYGRDERRSIELSLDNWDNALAHNPNGGFWYDKIIKAYKGTQVSVESSVPGLYTNLSWEVQVGEFMIDRISQPHFPYRTAITGRDYTKKCLLSKFTQSTTFTAGQSVDVLVKAIATNAGITKFLIPVTGKTIDRDFTYERNTERWGAMKALANSRGYELFFDSAGYLVMREYQDPLNAPLALSLDTGIAGNLVTFEKSTNDTRVHNHIVVIGASATNAILPVFAEAKNTEPSSATRIARLGDRYYEETYESITEQVDAQDLADKLLKIHALEEWDLNFSSITFPWIEVGEIVEFNDPRPGVGDPDRFLLTTLSLPMGLGPMSGNAKRVTVVG